MDCHVFRLIALELAEFLEGGRVERIGAPAPGVLALGVYNLGRRRELILRHERIIYPGQTDAAPVRSGLPAGVKPCLHWSAFRLPNPQRPSSMVMYLRKHVLGCRLGAAAIDWLHRRAAFSVRPAPHCPHAGPLWFWLDLRNGPRLSHEAPVCAQVMWPDAAALRAGHRELLADGGFAASYPVLSPPLRRSLLALDGAEAAALLADLAHEAEQGEGCLYLYSGEEGAAEPCAWPLPEALRRGRTESVVCAPAGRDNPDAPGFMEAARRVYEAQTAALPGLMAGMAAGREEKNALRRLRNALPKLEEEERRLRGLLDARARAELLRAALWRYDRDEKLPCLNLVDEAGRAHCLTLDEGLTLRENMELMFKRSARAARGLKFIAERRREIEAQLRSDETRPDQGVMAAGPPGLGRARVAPTAGAVTPGHGGQVSRFVSSDGFSLLRGRSARGNHELLKLARPHDLWLHVGGGEPGAQVLLRLPHPGARPPERALREAGILAALKSRRKHEARVEIISALAADVRPLRGGPPGAVTLRKQQPGFWVEPEAALEDRLKEGG
ncbi:MAG: hypothetical protein LBD82_06020 [Deltaproteobacteria bacterium]|jgi:hypothetical protein|nr:hypothetical protein [Deltaproteobacteria bacterium]